MAEHHAARNVQASALSHDERNTTYVAAPLFGRPEASAANVVKLAGNFMIASAIETMAEAFVFGEKNGLNQQTLADFFR